MPNVTISIESELLKRARIRAIEQGTSVNALIREYLTSLAGTPLLKQAMDDVIDLARRSQSGSGPSGRSWTREELYD
jgi:hypothetical protein